MLSALDISTSGLVAQRMRMIQISNNIANINSTHTSRGERVPYQPKTVVFESDESGNNGAAGVKVSSVQTMATEPIWKREPNHPDAAKVGPHAGEVAYPNIDLMNEFTNALEAARSYEANLGAMDITKSMEQQTLRILA
ncbi:MAG: flagellar basal body rod protein FlgC [Thermoguttaceae bacterium]|jgi:flagellar basal-body rod protein FlgC